LELLVPFIEKFKQIPIYETAEIHFTIKKIKEMEIPVIEKWLEAIQNCSYAVNQAEYEDLLDLNKHFDLA
jgi:hypothetical protein